MCCRRGPSAGSAHTRGLSFIRHDATSEEGAAARTGHSPHLQGIGQGVTAPVRSCQCSYGGARRHREWSSQLLSSSSRHLLSSRSTGDTRHTAPFVSGQAASGTRTRRTRASLCCHLMCAHTSYHQPSHPACMAPVSCMASMVCEQPAEDLNGFRPPGWHRHYQCPQVDGLNDTASAHRQCIRLTRYCGCTAAEPLPRLCDVFACALTHAPAVQTMELCYSLVSCTCQRDVDMMRHSAVGNTANACINGIERHAGGLFIC